MALVDASCTSELAALDIRYGRFKPEGVYFMLAFLTKKRIPGKPPKEVFFGAYPPNSQLCVVRYMSNAQRSSEAMMKFNRPSYSYLISSLTNQSPLSVLLIGSKCS